MKSVQLLQTILLILVVLVVGTYIVSTMIETSKTEIFECTEYKDVKFKYVGSGGLFGSIRQMETRSDDYDGWMEKCVIGNNLFGEEITR